MNPTSLPLVGTMVYLTMLLVPLRGKLNELSRVSIITSICRQRVKPGTNMPLVAERWSMLLCSSSSCVPGTVKDKVDFSARLSDMQCIINVVLRLAETIASSKRSLSAILNFPRLGK
jgi:hypothetical protein